MAILPTTDPYRRLVAAILLRAVRDARRRRPACHRESALAFLAGDEAEWMLAALGLEREALVEALDLPPAQGAGPEGPRPGGGEILGAAGAAA